MAPQKPARRTQAVFEAAIEPDPTERAALLDSACRGNAGLRYKAEELLGFLDEAPTQVLLAPLFAGSIPGPMTSSDMAWRFDRPRRGESPLCFWEHRSKLLLMG
jgi:hypothetical protein